MLLTLFTVQLKAQHAVATLPGDDPGAVDPGWVMANMLVMAAGKLCYPVVFFVFVITRYRLFHTEL
jgi:hypothetical protein